MRTFNLDKLNSLFGEDHSSDVDKIKMDDFLEEIWTIFKEYVAVFPKDLPKDVPPKRMAHEFKIDLKPDTTPSVRKIYKLILFELQEAKTQIDSMFHHKFI